MFFKKKQTIADTMQDKKIKELLDEVKTAETRLRVQTMQAFVCNGVIELYPEGADKNKARTDAERAKNLLVCAIGVYDDLANQYKQAFSTPFERVTTSYYSPKRLTSHEIIEQVYSNFFTK